MAIKIKDFPKVTQENFEEITNRYVVRKGYDYRVLKGVEKPKNDKQFADISRKLYGQEIHVECFAYPQGSFSHTKYSAEYKVKERHDDLVKNNPIYRLWEKKYLQYNGLKVLLDWCFGDVSTGGVAGSHYGQTKIETKADYERIIKWGNQEKNLDKAKVEQHNSLVDIFGFNPFS